MLLLFDLEKKNNGQAMNHKFNGGKNAIFAKSTQLIVTTALMKK